MDEFGDGEPKHSLEDKAPVEIVENQWAVSPAETLRQSLQEGTKVLEIGPGVLRYQNLYLNSKVFLMDISPKALERKPVGLRRTRGKVESIPYQDESFDAVVAANLPVKLIDWEEAVSEIKRVLKTDGLILVSFPIDKSEDVERQDVVRKATRLFQQEFKVEKAVKRTTPKFPEERFQLWILARKT